MVWQPRTPVCPRPSLLGLRCLPAFCGKDVLQGLAGRCIPHRRAAVPSLPPQILGARRAPPFPPRSPGTAPLSLCPALTQRRQGEASEHPPGPRPGHHLVHVTSNSVFPFPPCVPLPRPLHVTLAPGPASAGLVSTPPAPRAHLPPDAAGRTTAGRWGRRSSRPASSAWATTWRTTGRYAPPGPQRTVALTALLSLSPSLCLPSLGHPTPRHRVPSHRLSCPLFPALCLS